MASPERTFKSQEEGKQTLVCSVTQLILLQTHKLVSLWKEGSQFSEVPELLISEHAVNVFWISQVVYVLKYTCAFALGKLAQHCLILTVCQLS